MERRQTRVEVKPLTRVPDPAQTLGSGGVPSVRGSEVSSGDGVAEPRALADDMIRVPI